MVYAIFNQNISLLATADATSQSTAFDVIGNKSDSASNGSGASLIGLAKYITANMVDDSVIGALNDTTLAASADDDDSTTLVSYAKSIIDRLGNYASGTVVSRLDAILTDTGTTLDGKIDTIDGIVDAILVDTGTTIPALIGTAADTDIATDIANIATTLGTPADTDLATDIAAINTLIGTPADTDISTDLANLDTLIDGIKAKTDNLPSNTSTVLGSPAGASISDDIATLNAENTSSESTGTFSYLDAGGEQDVVEITTFTRIMLHGAFLDLSNMTQDGTIKAYYKIDGTNYREFYSKSFTVATDADGVWLELNVGIAHDFKITYEEGADETAARDIPFELVYEVKEA